MNLTQFVSSINSLGATGLDFLQESNRNVEALRRIRAGRDVELSRFGFSAGRTFPVGFAGTELNIPGLSGGGVGASLGTLTAYLPIIVIVIVLLMVLRK